VYRFVPASTGTYRVDPGLVGFWSPRVWVSTSCGVTSACLNADDDYYSITQAFAFRATAGVPVFIHIDDDSSGVGDFALRVTSVTPPPNDTCATAAALSIGSPVAVTLTNAVNDVRVCGAGADTAEALFSFTPAASGNYVFSSTSSSAVMYLTTSCGSTTCVSGS
jgi:hypothetical protein